VLRPRLTCHVLPLLPLLLSLLQLLLHVAAQQAHQLRQLGAASFGGATSDSRQQSLELSQALHGSR
jgi:hypothetical protein